MADWPSDKELEDIYRKGSERHDFQYSEKAWNDMETLLDDKKRKRRLFFLLFTIGILAIGYISLPLFSNLTIKKTSTIHDRNENSISKQNTSEQNNTKVISAPVSSGTFNSSITKENVEIESSKIQGQIVANSGVSQSKNIINPKSLTSSKTNQATLNSSSKARSDNSVINQKLSEPAIYRDLKISQDPSLNSIDKSIEAITQKSTASTTFTPLEQLEIIDIKKLASGDILSFNIPLLSESIVSDNLYKNSKFSYMALLGLESSWTPNGEYSRIDYNIGLKAGYAISKRFTLNIGAYYLQDSYIAEKGDYKPGNTFWKSQETPEFTAANCNMIELTTGISYALRQTEKSQLSLSVDLLSNFMLKEKYSYHFANEANNFESSWTTANRTFLNGLSISTNYRLNLTDKWHIEAGPYLKVPLEGIGHGHIMLSSIGLRVGIGL